MGLHGRDQVGRSIGADPKWVQRGLKSLYRLAPGVWHVNQVTGEVGGTVSGSGFTFKDGRLKTPGSASNGAILQHGLSVPLASTAFTLLIGVRSVTGVSWSLMSESGTAGTWTGWYGSVAGGIGSTNNNSFDGALSLTTDEVSAFGFGGANNLRGAGRTGTAIDATAQAPGTGSATTVALGWARHNAYNDNPGAAEFSFFAAFQGLLSYAEMQALVNDPEQLFRPAARRILAPVSAGGGSVSLIVADATHAHAADGLVLTSSTALSVADATHAHAADAITLVVGSVLTVAETSHAHAADSLTLTAASALAVADATHSHAADNITLSVAGATNLTVADALHGHAADALALTSAHALIVADATHSHTVDGLTLTAASVLAIQEALHAHAADNITLDASGAVNLLLADGLHAHTADGVALTVAAWLTVADALHGHAADNVVLTFGGAVVEPLARYTIAAKARRLTITAAARRLEIRK